MRSLIRESAVQDSDFLSEAEHTTTPHYYKDLADTTTYSGNEGLLLKSTADSIGFATWTTVSSTYNIQPGDQLLIDSSYNIFDLILPTTPKIGTSVSVIDAAHNCATNNVTVSGNGNKIMNLSEPFIVDVDGASFELIFCNTSVGWGLRR